MVTDVEAIPQMDAPVAGVLVVGCQCSEDSQLDATSVSVLGYGSDDLDGAFGAFLSVIGSSDLAECALAKEFHDLVYICISMVLKRIQDHVHRSVNSTFGTTT